MRHSDLRLAWFACLAACSTTHRQGEAEFIAQDGSAPDTSVDAAAIADDSGAPRAGEGWPTEGYELVRSGDRCELLPLPDGYDYMPLLICRSIPNNEGLACSRELATECARASDCTEHRFGRCEGIATAQCSYPYEPSTCATDADCTALPDGTCFPVVLFDEPLCDENGENCMPREPTCHYRPLDQPCASDDDCTAVSGGHCQREVVRTTCFYLGCETDTDCAAGQVCDCHGCVNADCRTDAECGTGERCRQGNPCGWGEVGDYHCTEPGDQCHTDDDCDEGRHCDYDDAGHFVCSDQRCEVP